MTTYKTLLLAVMVAGAATIASEAHAQSNTERLISINENTDSILDIVTVISDALVSIQESIDDLTSDLSTVTASSARVESAISGFGPTLDSIVSGVQLNAATLSDLSSIMAVMSTDISSIQASLVEGGDGGLTEEIRVLASTVNRNEVTTSDRLDAIEAAIDRLGIDPASPISSASLVGIVRGSVEEKVTTYTYKSQGEKLPGSDIYELDLTFSCNEEVLIDKVSTDISKLTPTWIITNPNPVITTPENYLTVDGQDLYSSRFESSPGRYLVFDREVEFRPKYLPAGQTLDFESQQNELGTQIKDSTRNANQRGYTITVDYLGSSSAKCSFGGTSSPSTGSLPEDDSLTLVPTVGGSRPIQTFSTDITCNNNPVEITGMTATVVDGWTPHLDTFAKFKLIYLDSNTEVDIGFADDGTLKPYNYPIAFHGEDIRVSGTIPSDLDVSLLIRMDYNTITGGSCTEK